MKIIKVTDHPVVDFAAEELKKYLRMMMPYAGEISFSRDANEEGFYLGTMDAFGLDTSDVEDFAHDDVIYMDTTEKGGIIAGSNPRSVLLCVYQYLQKQGCKFLFPGLDGEKIPVRDVTPVKYRKKADNRFRGECNEGAESQQCMMDAIDFAPKIGFNVFMMEFAIPKNYYDKYYNHSKNPMREAEPITPEQVLQWKRQCEVEIAKRGLLFHDMGHGWTAESFGISSINGWVKDENAVIPEEVRPMIAMINGKRDLLKGVALNTNFCMSNPEARKRVVTEVVKYAKISAHVDCLHVWLADWQKNHCECDACQKMIPSDWYVVLLNEIDEALEKENLPTKIGAIIYSDTAWNPEQIRIKNPKRFSFFLGAITRSYTYSVEKNPIVPLTPYVRNVSERFDTMEEYIMRSHLWQEMGAETLVAYEYHFWKAQVAAPGVISFAKRIYEDIISYKENSFSGIIEDGSQRAFFPNGFAYWLYGHSLFDMTESFDALTKEYFESCYGENAEIVLSFLEKMDELLPTTYLERVHSKRLDVAHFHDLSMIPKFEEAKKVIEAMREAMKDRRTPENRTELVATRLFTDYYLDYLTFIAEAFALRAASKDEAAKERFEQYLKEFGEKEVAIERYYDQHNFGSCWSSILTQGVQVEQ